MNKHEKFAWIRFAMTASTFAFLFWKMFFVDSPVEVTAWEEIHDNISDLFLVSMFAGAVLTRPGKGVVADERDRAISASAAKSALAALTLIIVVSGSIIGMDAYTDLLTTYPAAWFKHYLIACLALAWAIESSVCVFHHWRDRR